MSEQGHSGLRFTPRIQFLKKPDLVSFQQGDGNAVAEECTIAGERREFWA